MSPRTAALAGMIAVFAFVAAILTLAQYGFMVRLGWDPVGASEVPWPGVMALRLRSIYHRESERCPPLPGS